MWLQWATRGQILEWKPCEQESLSAFRGTGWLPWRTSPGARYGCAWNVKILYATNVWKKTMLGISLARSASSFSLFFIGTLVFTVRGSREAGKLPLATKVDRLASWKSMTKLILISDETALHLQYKTYSCKSNASKISRTVILAQFGTRLFWS